MFDQISKAFFPFFSRIGKQRTLTAPLVAELISPLREALIQADVSYAVVEAFCAELQDSLGGTTIPSSVQPDEYVAKVMYERLVAFLGGSAEKVAAFAPRSGSTIMVLGIQGSGKTTTLAKLGHFLRTASGNSGRKKVRVLAGSVDFYRPAAIDQLELVCAQAGIDFRRATAPGAVEAAIELQAYAREQKYDYLLLDTAGRMHIDEPLITELCAIDRALQPGYKILVLDAMTGQESLKIARSFDERVGFSSAILTKMDSETRGGCAFAFRYELKKPIIFVGVGEHVQDLEAFYPERAATQMLGMGDLATLTERLDAQLHKEEQELLVRAARKKDFSLEDFARQLDMISKLGSMGQLLRYLPGASQLQISPEQLEKGERDVKRFRALLSAMTRKERLIPGLLNTSRKRRIAAGAGVSLEDVNAFLVRFEEARRMLKNQRGMF
ncbi:MAG: signal recognition particle receptor subunit alpha [Candidatus Dependentiae bacterium]|nr:signal recognition particle receptor subunit alpha [Candidatus Dependentiae bacterium]